MPVLALVSALTAVAAVAAPAHAYDNNVSLMYEKVYTGSCTDAGRTNWATYERNGDCHTTGLETGFTFKKDSGGVGLAVAVRRFLDEKATVEFRPNGEIFRVCDRKNDGDTIYARLRYQISGNWHWMSTVKPPGTSKVHECTTKNYSFGEGRPVRIYIYDNKSLSKPILTINNLPAMGGRA